MSVTLVRRFFNSFGPCLVLQAKVPHHVADRKVSVDRKLCRGTPWRQFCKTFSNGLKVHLRQILGISWNFGQLSARQQRRQATLQPRSSLSRSLPCQHISNKSIQGINIKQRLKVLSNIFTRLVSVVSPSWQHDMVSSVRRSDDKNCIVYGKVNKLHKPKHNQHKFQDFDWCSFCFFDFGMKLNKNSINSIFHSLGESQNSYAAHAKRGHRAGASDECATPLFFWTGKANSAKRQLFARDLPGAFLRFQIMRNFQRQTFKQLLMKL